MSNAGITFDGVWKRFHRGELHDSLRDLVPALVRRITGKTRRADALAEGDFWAVRDVSFEVKPGETLGIIGGNGAGKSTTLKMLIKILRPTLGWCEVRGRVGALIEIAAGFHPDLTGRENIFLQGSIRGMSPALLKQQFDSIVEFSGIPEFIDTPIKRYSSGMNARLGFAIAAHLDPEVLIIDEVLSVGDFAFQSRAFGRIQELATSGIPVVIVSHQLDRIATLCTKAILLVSGQLAFEGKPTEAIARYTAGVSRASGATHRGPIRIDRIAADSDLPVPSGGWRMLTIDLQVNGGEFDADDAAVSVRLRSAQTGAVVFSTTTDRHDVRVAPVGTTRLQVSLQFNVAPGVYMVETGVLSIKRGVAVGDGPGLYVQVAEGPSFTGSAQLNPQMAVVPRGNAVPVA